jgi:hypothetical protein
MNMRPKKLFVAAAFLSLLLGAGSVWWWMHSGSRMNQVTLHQSNGDSMSVYGADGKFLLLRTSGVPQKSAQPGQLTWNTVPYAPGSADGQPPLKWSNFSYAHSNLGKGASESSLVLPVWLITAACCVMPMCWFNMKVKQVKKVAK